MEKKGHIQLWVILGRAYIGYFDRISPEAPVAVINSKKQTFMLGGAGNVVRNLEALGANVIYLLL